MNRQCAYEKTIGILRHKNVALGLGLIVYFLVLGGVLYRARLCPDAYYYWVWSRNLAWSYYDGPPLIAYIIRLYTVIFGESEFSLYLFSLSAHALTMYLIWKCTLFLFTPPLSSSHAQNNTILFQPSRADQSMAYKTARYAVLLWLLTPGSLQFFTMQLSCNNAMILFWGLSFYYFLHMIHSQKRRYYYLMGISFGCLLLAKYTGILLILSLFVACLWIKAYRFVFKRIDLYLGLCITCLLFSPVLIWNYQHDWSSFVYQLHHGFHSESVSHLKQVITYIVQSIAQYQFSLLALVALLWHNKNRSMDIARQLLLCPTAIVFCFFLMAAFFAPAESSWNAPFFFSGSILLASYLAPMQQTRLIVLMFFCLTISSIGLIIGNLWPKLNLRPGGGWGKSHAMHQIITQIPVTDYEGKTILTNDGPTYASIMTYFFKNHPAICPAQTLDQPYYTCWQETESKQNMAITRRFIYISEGPLPASHVLFYYCKFKHRYKYQQKNLLFADMTWSLYWYDCSSLSKHDTFIAPLFFR